MAESRSDKKSQPSNSSSNSSSSSSVSSSSLDDMSSSEQLSNLKIKLENAIELARNFQKLVSEFAELPAQQLNMEALYTDLQTTLELGQDETAHDLLMNFRTIIDETCELIRQKTLVVFQKITGQMKDNLSPEMVYSLFEEAVIIKRVDEKTRSKVSINELLRD